MTKKEKDNDKRLAVEAVLSLAAMYYPLRFVKLTPDQWDEVKKRARARNKQQGL